jgi:hypothetical protein
MSSYIAHYKQLISFLDETLGFVLRFVFDEHLLTLFCFHRVAQVCFHKKQSIWQFPRCGSHPFLQPCSPPQDPGEQGGVGATRL